MANQQEKIGCIPEATLAGIPVVDTQTIENDNVELPPPGTSVVAFISKLYELVNNSETQHYICWSEEFNKKAIMIPDPVEFSKEILPKYFKHSNICSFVRQLNIYGFRKLETQSGFCFRHESFIADRPELLPNIQRKKNQLLIEKKQTTDDTTSLYQYLLSQLVQLQKQNANTQTQINTLKEMLYQLKMREDTLEVKLYRLSETVMPSLNYGSMMFTPGSVMSQTTGNTSTPMPPQSNDGQMPNYNAMMGYPMSGNLQQPQMQSNTQQMPTQQMTNMDQWGQQKGLEEQQQDTNGFSQWDFQSQIPWKF
ncbi:Heat stress transcription factor C-1 [Entamoeba marina]